MKFSIKCSQCSKDKFVNMPFAIEYCDTDSSLLTDSVQRCTTSPSHISAYLCLNCGHIELFSDKPNFDLAEIKKIESKLFELYKKIPSKQSYALGEMLNHHKKICQLLEKPQDLVNDDIVSKLENELGSFCRANREAYTEESRYRTEGPVIAELRQLETDWCNKYIAYIKFMNTCN